MLDVSLLHVGRHFLNGLWHMQVMQMDILGTKDGVPVVFHDINMKRATGLDADIRQVLTPQRPVLIDPTFLLTGLPMLTHALRSMHPSC